MRGINISQWPDSPDRTVTISVTPRDAEDLLHELRHRKWPHELQTSGRALPPGGEWAMNVL